jgi:uncharacterized protein YhaN
MPEKCALSAATSSHDDKDITPVHRKGKVTLDNEITKCHREVLYNNVRFWLFDHVTPSKSFLLFMNSQILNS